MRRALIRGLIVLAFLVLVLAVWIVAGRQISMLVDRAKTVFLKSLPVTPLNLEEFVTVGRLQIGEIEMSTKGTDYQPFPMQISVDSKQQPVLSIAGKSFLLAPEPGDETTFTMERSLLSWPTPFDLNFMNRRFAVMEETRLLCSSLEEGFGVNAEDGLAL